LQRLYPEGEGICHHVLVHPPGGLVGGDTLDIHARLGAGSHALVTTPGATRFYRSTAELAHQRARVELGPDARLDWLPLETIAYDRCHARNEQRFELAPGAEMFGWDLLALGLPASGQRWDGGRFQQHLEVPGVWLEQARVHADDERLLRSPLGWNDQRVLGTFWFTAGQPIERERADALLDVLRQAIAAAPAGVIAGASWQHPRLIVVRALGPRVEPVFDLFKALWLGAREAAWGLPPSLPRLWRL
jgi:urease accessory protein